MQIKIKDIGPVIQFLDRLKVKGLKSIHRTNISNKLKAKGESVHESEMQLREEYKKDRQGFEEEIKKLLDTNFTIDDTDSKIEIESLKSIVKTLVADDSEEEFAGAEALGLAAVYEALELNK